MINSDWTEPCHHIKQDPLKERKKDTQYNREDMTDMTFIGPDVDMISIIRKGSYLSISYMEVLFNISNYLVNISF